MSHKIAKLFVNGGSQAVRLPAEFRFEASEEVFIRRDTVTGDVVLSSKPASSGWADFFALRELARGQAEVPADFMDERPLNGPLQPRAALEER